MYDAKINRSNADQLFNAIALPSCFLNVVMSTFTRHSLNARNVINWKRYFKEKIFKKCLGERIKNEFVIIRIYSYFSAFH